MIALLAKVFIKDRQNYSDGTVRKKYGTLTGITGIVLNVFLFIGKFIAGSISGAISIMADAFNNLFGCRLISDIACRLYDGR